MGSLHREQCVKVVSLPGGADGHGGSENLDGLEGEMIGRFCRWALILIGLAWSTFLISPNIARAEGQGCASNSCSKECAGACKTKYDMCELKARTLTAPEYKGKTDAEQIAMVKKR